MTMHSFETWIGIVIGLFLLWWLASRPILVVWSFLRLIRSARKL